MRKPSHATIKLDESSCVHAVDRNSPLPIPQSS
jgi:hypothetical protein